MRVKSIDNHPAAATGPAETGVSTHVQFKHSDSDAAGSTGASQSDEVTAANVAGEQRCSHLNKSPWSF